MEEKSEEGAVRLKSVKSDITQGKLDADKYADSANTIIISIIQHASQTTLGQWTPGTGTREIMGPTYNQTLTRPQKQQITPPMTPRSRMPSPDFKQHEMAYKWPNNPALPPTQ